MKTTQWLFERSDNKVKELEEVKRIYEKHGFDTDGIQWLLGKEKAARSRYRFLIQEEEKNLKKFYEDIACPMVELMAAWIEQVGEAVKETGVPKNIEIGHEGEYILYTVDCDDFLEDAKELYENGWRLVSTKTEKIPDFWGTGLALKLVA